VVGDPIGDTSPFASFDRPDGGAAAQQSGQGMRVAAVIGGLVLCFVVVTVAAVLAVLYYDPTPPVVATNDADPTEVPEITTTDNALPDLNVVVQPRYTPKPTVEPAARVFKPLTVVIGDGTHFNGVSAKCPGMKTIRGRLNGTSVTLPGLPVDTQCSITFQGGKATRPQKARGGQSITCTFGSVTKCK